MLQGCLALLGQVVENGKTVTDAVRVRGGMIVKLADGETRMVSHQSDSACYLMTVPEGTPEGADVLPTFYNPREIVALRDNVTCEMLPVRVAMIDEAAKRIHILTPVSDVAL